MGTFTNWTAIVVAACSLILQLRAVRGQSYFLSPMCGISYPAGAGRIAGKIMHGQDATLGSAPFMAYLIRDGDLHCGGTIISQRYILTAAHCVYPDITVRLGEYNTQTDPDCGANKCFPSYEDFSIEAISRHKDFVASTFTNDIALIKLSRNIAFRTHIMPICLLLNPTNAPYWRQLQAFGWGKTHRGRSSSVLQTTRLDRYPNSHCEQRLYMPLTNNQICLGLRGSDTCAGDSGGPMVTQVNFDGVIRYLQLGLVSFGERECQSPGVYIYVPHYIGWIRRVMQTLGH